MAEDTLGRILPSTESLVRRRPTKAIGGGWGGGGNESGEEVLTGPSCDSGQTEAYEVQGYLSTRYDRSDGSSEEANTVPVLSASGRLGE